VEKNIEGCELMIITKTKDFVRLDIKPKDEIRLLIDIVNNGDFIREDLSFELPYADGKLVLLDNSYQRIYEGEVQRLIKEKSLIFNRMRDKGLEKEMLGRLEELM